MKRSIGGFTIVELLVVIVVVGILAAITIVSYSNIQTRAYNTQVISGVSSYLKLIETYRTLEGKYPPTSRELAGKRIAITCLGTGYKDNYCGKVTDVDTYEDETFNQEIRKVGSGGSVSSTELTPGPETFVGAVYGIDWIGSTSYARSIQYALKGRNADCKLSGAQAYIFAGDDDVTPCELILENVENRSHLAD